MKQAFSFVFQRYYIRICVKSDFQINVFYTYIHLRASCSVAASHWKEHFNVAAVVISKHQPWKYNSNAFLIGVVFAFSLCLHSSFPKYFLNGKKRSTIKTSHKHANRAAEAAIAIVLVCSEKISSGCWKSFAFCFQTESSFHHKGACSMGTTLEKWNLNVMAKQ